MNKKYQSPEAVEVGSASEVVLGEKDGGTIDSAYPFVQLPWLSVDVDE